MLWTVLLAAAQAAPCASPEALSEHLHSSACPTLSLMAAWGQDGGCAPLSALGMHPVLAGPSDMQDILPPGSDKQLRDAYSLPNARESQNFVLRWGNQASLSNGQADAILQTFESAWEKVLIAMDYNLPRGAETFKFNLYMGSTGNGGPSAYGAAYYSGDPEGYPMIVISDGTYDDPGYGKVVGAHEFFHALQGAAGSRYEYSESAPGAWYWEATANWIETEIYPEDQAYYVSAFLVGFVLFPHLPVNFFDYPDGSGGLVEYHQYGAFIFPYYLTREVADASLIRSTWLESSRSDPLQAIDDELQAQWGTTVSDVFFDFAAWNATYQRYDDGAVFAQYVEYYDAQYSRDSQRIIDTVQGDSDGWQAAPTDTAPRTFGANYVRIIPGSADVVVAFEGDASGSRGSTPRWDVRVVVNDGGTDLETSVSLKDDAGSLLVADSAGAEEVWLVVSVVSDDDNTSETFGWSYMVSEDDNSDPIDTGEPGGEDSGAVDGRDPDADKEENWQSCATVQGSGAAGLVILALLCAAGRRETS